MNVRRSRGFTLTELMIAAAIGLIVVAAVTTFYLSTTRTGTESLKVARLNQYLRAAMDLMVSDIRRAGYWAAPGNQYRNSSGYIANPFTQGSNNVASGNRSGEPANSCITFAYDASKDGTVQTGGSPLERFGFRRRDNMIEMRQSGGDPFNCDNGTWHDMLDDAEIEISDLTFAINVSPNSDPFGELSAADMRIRTVAITISGRLKSDASVSRTLRETVRIRNDKFGT